MWGRGACVVGGMCGSGMCMAEGMHGGGICDKGACMARGAACMAGSVQDRFPLKQMVRILLECILFKNIFKDMSLFCGATDTPVLDFQ